MMLGLKRLTFERGLRFQFSSVIESQASYILYQCRKVTLHEIKANLILIRVKFWEL